MEVMCIHMLHYYCYIFFLSIFQSVTRLRAKGIGTLCGRLFLGTAEKIPPSELIDTTGAGDAFIGAVIYGMCNHSIHMFFRCSLSLYPYICLYACFVIFPVISLAFQDGFSQIICPEGYYHFTFNIIQQVTFAMSNVLSFQI